LSVVGGDLDIVNGRIDSFNFGKCENMLEYVKIGWKMFKYHFISVTVFENPEKGWKMLKHHFINVTVSGNHETRMRNIFH